MPAPQHLREGQLRAPRNNPAEGISTHSHPIHKGSQVLYKKIAFLPGNLCEGYRKPFPGDEPFTAGESCQHGWFVLLQGLGLGQAGGARSTRYLGSGATSTADTRVVLGSRRLVRQSGGTWREQASLDSGHHRPAWGDKMATAFLGESTNGSPPGLELQLPECSARGDV